MDFLFFLFCTKLISKKEFYELLNRQLRIAFGNVSPPGSNWESGEFASAHLDEIDDLERIRTLPIGELLKSDPQLHDLVCRRAEASFDEIVEGYWLWGRRRMEPLARYSIASHFGRSLYENQEEKKLVANFLVSAKVRNGRSIIKDGDSVVLPEGSSAFYCGLAISEHLRNVTVVTSNDVLLREFRDNPLVARGLRRLIMVGGVAEYDDSLQRSEYGGFYGEACHDIYHRCIYENPGATILVVPCTSICPSEGPTSHDSNSATTKLSLIRDAVSSGVREVVLIADHTKHRQGAGIEIDSAGWEKFISDNRGKVSLVSCPPPDMRRWMVTNPSARDVSSRIVRGNADPSVNTKQNLEYDRSAKEFADILGDQVAARFHEAYTFAETGQHQASVSG